MGASRAGVLGAPRRHFARTDSTNTRARELAVAGAPHGALVTAGEQTAGRGRQGRTWSAPPGRALLCSVLLREVPRLLPLLAGVAVAEVCDSVGAPATVKWPNDVLVDGLKVAGILVEGRPQEGWAVLGIGVNVAVDAAELPAELEGRAGSLGLGPDALEPVRAALLERLEAWLRRPEAELLEAVRARDALLGRPVSWSGEDHAGTGAGIDADGRLLVDTPAGRVALEAGEVHLGSSGG